MQQLQYGEIPYKKMVEYSRMGKAMEPLRVEHRAELIFGRKQARNKLTELLGCSPVSVHKAFRGLAPLKLYQIDQLLKEYEAADNKKIPTEN